MTRARSTRPPIELYASDYRRLSCDIRKFKESLASDDKRPTLMQMRETFHELANRALSETRGTTLELDDAIFLLSELEYITADLASTRKNTAEYFERRKDMNELFGLLRDRLGRVSLQAMRRPIPDAVGVADA
jgi:hypothetical protein